MPTLMEADIIKTDVLIAGAGAAGIRAAQAAKQQGADVLLIGEYPGVNSGSTYSGLSNGWGIQAFLEAEDSPAGRRLFRDDILAAGLGQCRESLVEILVAESAEAIENLLAHGLRLRKDESGVYVRNPGCFSTAQRAFRTESLENIIKTFARILNQNCLQVVPGQILELIIVNGECCGAVVLVDGKQPAVVAAGATILATGGGAAIYENNIVSRHQIGDGYALAARAGACIENIEFIQFMLGVVNGCQRLFLPLDHLGSPRMFSVGNQSGFLETAISDATLREKAVNDRTNHFPFSCRDHSYLIDAAIHKVYQEGGDVLCADQYDSLQNSRVVHFAQSFNGGVWIDERAESSVPGLYAAGEVAAGPHGADRIGGCMMTATQVFGKRAGEYAAQRSMQFTRHALPSIHLSANLGRDFVGKNPAGGDYLEIEKQVKKAMQLHVCVARDREGLEKCLAVLQDSAERLERVSEKSKASATHAYRVRNMISTARLVTMKALDRALSLGSHFRSDHSPASVDRFGD